MKNLCKLIELIDELTKNKKIAWESTSSFTGFISHITDGAILIDITDNTFEIYLYDKCFAQQVKQQ